jgi:hypothetical protein
MGGNLVLKLAGELADQSPAWLRAAAAVSPSVITLKPATCYQFKTGHFAWIRRDCFTLLPSVGARCTVARRVKVRDAPPGSRLAE